MAIPLFGFGGGLQDAMCGGYSSHETGTKSLLGKVSGLKTFSLNYATEKMKVSLTADLDTGEASSGVSVQGYYGDTAQSGCARTLTEDEKKRLEEAVFAGKILDFNGFSVMVNGLPLIEDCSLFMTFAEGGDYGLSFNGARGPVGFREELVKLFPVIFDIARYEPGKGRPSMPPMNQVLGVHKFEFEDGKKHGTLTVNLESFRKREGVEGHGELFSEGDFGKKHFRISASPVVSGDGRYDLYLVHEYEDSVGVTPDNWKFAAMLEMNYRGDISCEAFSAMPNLKDRKKVFETEKQEKLSSAFLYSASGDAYKTVCLYRDDRESMDYFLRAGQYDPASGRFFYSVYKVDPEFLKNVESLALTMPDPWQYREYFELGSEMPMKSQNWLQLNFRYGRSMIISVEAIHAAAERLKVEEIKEAHVLLFQQMCQALEQLARPEDILKQGACPSRREVVEYITVTGDTGCRCVARPDASELNISGPFINRHKALLMQREMDVAPGGEMTPEQLMEALMEPSVYNRA